MQDIMHVIYCLSSKKNKNLINLLYKRKSLALGFFLKRCSDGMISLLISTKIIDYNIPHLPVQSQQ